MANIESAYTHPHAIESISDILDIVSNLKQYISEILDEKRIDREPLGRNHLGTPRPFPHGLWFRGQPRIDDPPIPSVFRTKTKEGKPQFYDEREMFNDLRLRSAQSDLRGYSNLELMCLMQHHSLSTRLMDWSESPLIATFFAVSSQYYGMPTFYERDEDKRGMSVENECSLYVLNSYRLNKHTNLSCFRDSNIFHPQDIDVVLRSVMAEHTYLESIASKISALDYVALDRVAAEVETLLEAYMLRIYNNKLSGGQKIKFDLEQFKKRIAASSFEVTESKLDAFEARLAAPVAVIPKRNHARMDAQLSCFTIHGGKQTYSDALFKEENHIETEWQRIPKPIHLHEINEDTKLRKSLYNPDLKEKYSSEPFMKKFRISKLAVSRMMIELDRLGITEAMIYPDIERQSGFVKRRWATIVDDKPIWAMPRLSKLPTWQDNEEVREESKENNYMERLYGQTNGGDSS